MNPTQINEALSQNFIELKSLFDTQGAEFYMVQPEGKWTAGQHVIHLVQSTEPLLKAMRFPGFVLGWKFGKNNREVRDYDSIVNRYHEKLAAIGNVVSPFSSTMPTPTSDEMKEWIDKLDKLNKKLAAKTLSKSYKSLDTYLVPHPLMGRMTLREILMWNAYHTKHHVDILKQKYTK
jgi:DinB superfamily